MDNFKVNFKIILKLSFIELFRHIGHFKHVSHFKLVCSSLVTGGIIKAPCYVP